MDIPVIFHSLGLIAYQQAWDYQEQLFAEAVACKQFSSNAFEQSLQATNHLIFCQHPHVFTIGKSGKMHNLLVNDTFLETVKATVVSTNRGGDITYHGPGQLVGYPIFDLEQFGLHIKSYMHLLEEAIIRLLAEYGIIAARLDGATGVWLDVGGKRERKICAMGVRASRYVTMHGFALNVNTDLSYFSHINPCGFIDKGVTSMKQELNTEVDLEEIQLRLSMQLATLFNIRYII